MAESIRFHLDENVDRVIASGLRRLIHHVLDPDDMLGHVEFI
jgi:hypothetical protein